MGLSVYLMSDKPIYQDERIFIRDNGQIREVTRSEWNDMFPGIEPVVVQPEESCELFHANITHNLNAMAGEAGIYEHLWHPEQLGITTAEQLIDPLRDGLALLSSDRERFEKFNPKNGWGDYDGLVYFVEKYLTACIFNPTATIEVSR